MAFYARRVNYVCTNSKGICISFDLYARICIAGGLFGRQQCAESEGKEISQQAKQNAGSSGKVVVSTGSAAAVVKSANVSAPDDVQQAFLLNIKKSANAGKVINCEFPLKVTIEDVEAKWGKADKVEWIAAAKGNYSTYNQKNVVFGYNKGSEIFEVRSFDKQLSAISLSNVEKVLGVPEYQYKTKTQNIIGYTIGNDYKMLFVFLQTFGENDSVVNHYSVLYPDATQNNMSNDPGRQW